MKIIFVQNVAESGYYIDGDGCLAQLDFTSPTKTVTIGLERTSICRCFSRIEDEGAVIRFANAYGPLGIERDPAEPVEEYHSRGLVSSVRPSYTGPQPSIMMASEPLQEWLGQAKTLRNCLRFLEAANTASIGKSRPFRDIYMDLFDESYEGSKLWPEQIGSQEFVATAKSLLFEAVNHVVAQLGVWLQMDNGLWKVRPQNLLSAIWLEFGQIVIGERSFQTCANPDCEKSFEVGIGAKRRHARYCSPACKNEINNGRRPTTRASRRAIDAG